MANDLSRWLVTQDQRHIHNWTVIREPDEFMASRFWMVVLPRGATTKVKFLYEYTEHDGIMDFANGDEVSDERLTFWYNAQRVENDW